MFLKKRNMVKQAKKKTGSLSLAAPAARRRAGACAKGSAVKTKPECWAEHESSIVVSINGGAYRKIDG